MTTMPNDTLILLLVAVLGLFAYFDMGMRRKVTKKPEANPFDYPPLPAREDKPGPLPEFLLPLFVAYPVDNPAEGYWPELGHEEATPELALFALYSQWSAQGPADFTAAPVVIVAEYESRVILTELYEMMLDAGSTEDAARTAARRTGERLWRVVKPMAESELPISMVEHGRFTLAEDGWKRQENPYQN
jgi:hypothetical protein